MVSGSNNLSHSAERTLDRLEAAGSLSDIANFPGHRLEKLKGDRAGTYSVRINDQWRVCFRWPEGSSGPEDVTIVDYH
jgi:proteic killer suppression protein